MISWACELFGEKPLGCQSAHIRRVATICSCASTQRGWLSAWAFAHQIAGVGWLGDDDPILAGIRAGTFKHQVPRASRKRISACVARKLLKVAMESKKWWWSAILVIAYSFLLRMPSELFKQYQRSLLLERSGKFLYGPIRRKQRQDWCTPVAFCYCGVDKALCLHAWLPFLNTLCQDE